MFKKILFLIILILVVFAIIPFGLNYIYKLNIGIPFLVSEWSAGETLAYIGGALSFIGTIVLGYITIVQNKNATEISNKMLDKEIINQYCFIQLTGKAELLIKHNNNSRITLSAHHKEDFGANNLIEQKSSIDKAKKLNEYYIKIFYKDLSKSMIKSIKIKDVICVQEPNKNGGLFWEDNSDDPIPCGLDVELYDNVNVNWIDENEFFIHFKIYSPVNGCISNMFENEQPTCFMYNLSIISNANVKTEILFKLWFNIHNGKFEIIRYCQNTIENPYIIK